VSEAVKELERAKKALRAAQALFKESLLEDALSRSYYAVLHAAKSMLLCKGVSVASHEAVKRLFGFYFIKTNEIDSRFAEILRFEHDDRMLADYDVGLRMPECSLKKRFPSFSVMK
jgi:uncharacterized protein (UPF0332 family)